MKFKLKKIAGVGLVSVGMVSSAAFAQGTGGVDVSSVTAALTAAAAAIATIGVAWLAMTVGARVYKWVKSAI
ncbi:hypothetical protein EKH80_02860 [Dyella choica]|uniref:Methyltransferase n=2 Tax=Dyella choica TaxID=1927959 RepID=A0A3S0RMX7_9GAMM|nr:hypothetical protein EKH80_02860 [Dyella choica]